MTFDEAYDEVMREAHQPTLVPDEAVATVVSGEEFARLVAEKKISTMPVKREELTKAQGILCRWIWDKCARNLQPFEHWEAGFCRDTNPSQELALWFRITTIFSIFAKRHRSENPRHVVAALCNMTFGIPDRLSPLSRGRTRELRQLWENPPTEELVQVIDELIPE